MPVSIISVTNLIFLYRTINNALYNYQRNELVELFAEQSTMPVMIISANEKTA